MTSRRPSEFERHVVPDGAAVFGSGDAHVDEAELFVILIVSVNRLIYIKSLNDFRDFFYS